jgi:hypothetical protein
MTTFLQEQPKDIFETYSPKNYILIKGARVNNLKNLSVAIPRNKLIVITGLSGSGKSSLAFDTLFAEGSANVCRESELLCPPVSWKNGKTGGRLHSGYIACHCHRAKGEYKKPADLLSALPQKYMTI